MKKTAVLFLLTLSFSAFSQAKFSYDAVQKVHDHLNEFCSNPKTSILKSRDLKNFKALDFFPINENFYVVAKFIRTPNEKPFKIKTFRAAKVRLVKYGEVYFALDNKEYKLNLYQNITTLKCNNLLLLPFSDFTNGRESYSGGRYVDIEIPEGNTVVIDFNKSYNPCEAFKHACCYCCPHIPSENDLPTEIKAGVKKFLY